MHATPNQDLLTLPSSPVGKSSDLHAEVQQFKPNSGHKFFFYTHIRIFCTCTHALVCVCMCVCVSYATPVYTLITAWCTCLHPYFGHCFLLSVVVACYTLR